MASGLSQIHDNQRLLPGEGAAVKAGLDRSLAVFRKAGVPEG